MHDLAPWENFYLILGPAAGALIGLQFVVMTLVAEQPHRSAEDVGNAFSTPTVVHFAMVLLIACMAAAPWGSIRPLALLVAAIGVFGVGYTILVARRMSEQDGYHTETVDWLSYIGVPGLVYAVLALCAFWTLRAPAEGLFGVGFAALALLFTGVYNCWDGIVFLVARKAKIAAKKQDATKDDRQRP